MPKRTQTANTSEAVWVRFGFQLDSLESDPLSAENRAGEQEIRV